MKAYSSVPCNRSSLGRGLPGHSHRSCTKVCPASHKTRLQPAKFQPDAAQVIVRKNLTGPCVVPLVGKRNASIAVVPHADPDANLQVYMSHAAEHFANFQLPLGGKLTRLDATHMELTVPKIEIFDVWLQPKAVTKVTVHPDRAEITSTTGDCKLQGSQHVEQMGLNDRFNLDVRITFTWDDAATSKNPKIHVNGSLAVEVDIPAPFSFMPKPVLKAAGDTSMAAVLAVMMPTFLEKLAADYNKWAEQVSMRKLSSNN